MPSRIHAFPPEVVEPIWLFPDDSTLKAHSGSTAAKAGSFAAAVLVLVNAGRIKQLLPQKSMVRKIESRHGHEIEEILGILPAALTANEASYLIGFRSPDEIRNRLVKAREETDRRLRSKGIER